MSHLFQFLQVSTNRNTLVCYCFLSGMDYSETHRKPQFLGKLVIAVILTALCILILKQSPSFSGLSVVWFIQINLGRVVILLFFLKKKILLCRIKTIFYGETISTLLSSYCFLMCHDFTVPWKLIPER